MHVCVLCAHTHSLTVGASVCVCVCVRERERERECVRERVVLKKRAM